MQIELKIEELLQAFGVDNAIARINASLGVDKDHTEYAKQELKDIVRAIAQSIFSDTSAEVRQHVERCDANVAHLIDEINVVSHKKESPEEHERIRSALCEVVHRLTEIENHVKAIERRERAAKKRG